MNSIVKLYSIAHSLYKNRIPVAPHLITWFIRRYYNADIPHALEAGENLHLGHAGLGIIIHPRSVIGRNVTIAQHVTIGGNKGSIGVPKIGNNVYIGPGAKVLGEICIGNNVIVGANAVVLKSVENNVVVVGVPAKIVRRITKRDTYPSK